MPCEKFGSMVLAQNSNTGHAHRSQPQGFGTTLLSAKEPESFPALALIHGAENGEAMFSNRDTVVNIKNCLTKPSTTCSMKRPNTMKNSKELQSLASQVHRADGEIVALIAVYRDVPNGMGQDQPKYVIATERSSQGSTHRNVEEMLSDIREAMTGVTA